MIGWSNGFERNASLQKEIRDNFALQTDINT
jgi:hypothetical protein